MMRILMEAAVVGALLAVLLWLASKAQPLDTPMHIATVGFCVGAAFHLACEATGVNRAYALAYCKRLGGGSGSGSQ